MGYIDAQLKMAADAERAMIAERHRLEGYYGGPYEVPDWKWSRYEKLQRISMRHYRLALHAAGLLDDLHVTLRPNQT